MSFSETHVESCRVKQNQVPASRSLNRSEAYLNSVAWQGTWYSRFGSPVVRVIFLQIGNLLDSFAIRLQHFGIHPAVDWKMDLWIWNGLKHL